MIGWRPVGEQHIGKNNMFRRDYERPKIQKILQKAFLSKRNLILLIKGQTLYQGEMIAKQKHCENAEMSSSEKIISTKRQINYFSL